MLTMMTEKSVVTARMMVNGHADNDDKEKMCDHENFLLQQRKLVESFV